MITVSEARSRLFDLISPVPAEDVPLIGAAGRVLARDVVARRDQPPFSASSMDGYALKAVEVEAHAMFRIVGESAAGHRFAGSVGPGQAVRIFTGAPMPEGADFVVMQENVERKGDVITGADSEAVLHAGTARNEAGELVSAGGRVLNVIGTGATLADARDNAYAVLKDIAMDGGHYRSDIALPAVEGKISV